MGLLSVPSCVAKDLGRPTVSFCPGSGLGFLLQLAGTKQGTLVRIGILGHLDKQTGLGPHVNHLWKSLTGLSLCCAEWFQAPLNLLSVQGIRP